MGINIQTPLKESASECLIQNKFEIRGMRKMR
jgi:hypothetical protein